MPATAAGAPRTEAADLAAWWDVPRLAGRLLLRHWPALLCLFFAQRVAYDLRLSFFQQLQRLSFGFHDKIHSGDLVTRGMLDLEGTRAFIQGGMMQSLTLVMLLSVSALVFARRSG